MTRLAQYSLHFTAHARVSSTVPKASRKPRGVLNNSRLIFMQTAFGFPSKRWAHIMWLSQSMTQNQ